MIKLTHCCLSRCSFFFDLKLIQFLVASKHNNIAKCKTAVFGKASSKSGFPSYLTLSNALVSWFKHSIYSDSKHQQDIRPEYMVTNDSIC